MIFNEQFFALVIVRNKLTLHFRFLCRTNPLYEHEGFRQNEIVKDEASKDVKTSNENVPTTSSSSGYSSSHHQRLPLPQVSNLHGGQAMNSDQHNNNDEGMMTDFDNN